MFLKKIYSVKCFTYALFHFSTPWSMLERASLPILGLDVHEPTFQAVFKGNGFIEPAS
jgi:hypothetical protein